MHIQHFIFSQKDGVPRNVPTPKIYPPPLHYHVSFLGNNCQNRASFTHVSIFPFSHVNLRCVPFPQVYLDSRISPGRNWLSWWASVDTLPMCSSSNWLESEEFTLNSFIWISTSYREASSTTFPSMSILSMLWHTAAVCVVLDILFSLNHNIHKSWHGLCFWALVPFIDGF